VTSPTPRGVIKAVVFDFDGVIVESEPYWDEADRRVVEEAGGRYRPEVKGQATGLPPAESMRRLLALHELDVDPAPLLARREQMMARYYDTEIPAVVGMPALIHELARRGLTLSIGTSTPARLVRGALARLGLAGRFRDVVSPEQVRRGKPSPDVFLRAMDLIDARPEETVVVEDSAPGIAAARASGATVVWRVNEHAPEAGAGVPHHLREPADLLAILERLA
jgi:HAD superfamily hydrolase (TIGR01509 family)